MVTGKTTASPPLTASKPASRKSAKGGLNLTMDDLLTQMPPEPIASGDLIEAQVLSTHKNEVWLDLGLQGTGLVARRELDAAHNIKIGDTVQASVIEAESEYGFAILSLKKVAKEKGWDRLQKLQEESETIIARPYDANRGGLLVELEGIRGFLPVSQLTAAHYPRVANADKDEILQRLNDLVKVDLKVRILDMDREQNKLIVSEKEALREDTRDRLGKLKIGDIVDGLVTGAVDFGAFVTIDGIEGLVHISEISWDRVSNPANYVRPGQTIKVKIIAMDGDKLSLSMKQLTEDPWLKEIKKFKLGDKVQGTITRITPFGAFIQIRPAVEALVHVSELGPEKSDSKAHFEVGETRAFRVLEIDTAGRKISLSLNNPAKPKKTSEPAAKAAKSVLEQEA